MKKSEILKTVFKILLWFVAAVLILTALLSLFSKSELLPQYKVFTVLTGSMKPTIYPGDLILISKQDSYNVGDIVTFNTGTGESQVVVTHRIVGSTQDQENTRFTTQGDFNSVEDIDTIVQEDILGKYLFKLPLLGYLVNFVQTPVGLILLILIPCTIMIFREVLTIREELQKRKLKHEEIE